MVGVMSAYYNEFDPNATAWLRELIIRGQIAAEWIKAVMSCEQ